MCAVRSAQYFLKFVTELIGIDFLIIETDAYLLGLVFRPIAVWFGRLSLIGLVGFNISLNTYYSVILNRYSPALPLKIKKKKIH